MGVSPPNEFIKLASNESISWVTVFMFPVLNISYMTRQMVWTVMAFTMSRHEVLQRQRVGKNVLRFVFSVLVLFGLCGANVILLTLTRCIQQMIRRQFPCQTDTISPLLQIEMCPSEISFRNKTGVVFTSDLGEFESCLKSCIESITEGIQDVKCSGMCNSNGMKIGNHSFAVTQLDFLLKLIRLYKNEIKP